MDYKKAANHWIEKDAKDKHMERGEILIAIAKYIRENNTCALATGAESFVRCTPIEYTYHDGAFWMFSEGGQKFVGLEKNKNVCLAIYDKYDGFGNLKGMQVTGVAEIVEPFTDEYCSAAEFRRIPMEALRNLPEPMNLIKVLPVKIECLNSDFKRDGYASRQVVEF